VFAGVRAWCRCVCVRVCLRVCVRAKKQTVMCVRECVYTHTHTHTHVDVHVHVFISYVHTSTHRYRCKFCQGMEEEFEKFAGTYATLFYTL